MYDELVEKYMRLRERKGEIKKQYEAQVAKIDEGMDRIEAHFLAKLTETGTESVRTQFGTVYKKTTTSATLGDKDMFRNYCQTNDAWHLADIKANPVAVREYREEHDDIPPGVNFSQAVVIQIRKS